MLGSLKFLILSLSLFLFAASAKSQLWKGLGLEFDDNPGCFFVDSANGLLYIGGHHNKVNGQVTGGIISYDGMNWDSLPGNPLGYPIHAITKYQGKIYAGGVYGLASWNGIKWDTIHFDVVSVVWALHVYQNKLLVGGSFDSIGVAGLHTLAAWDGNSFSEVFGSQSVFNLNTQTVNAIKDYKGELYIGGNFTIGNMLDIMKWNGSAWTDVGGGIKGGWWVNDFQIFMDELYVGGYFVESAGAPGNHIARWDGWQWSALGCGMSIGQVSNMTVYNSKLYACGQFTYAGCLPVKYVAHWDGSTWCNPGGDFDNIIHDLVGFQDTLYIAGGFLSVDGDSMQYFAKWVGGNHTDSCLAVGWESPVGNNVEGVNVFPNPVTDRLYIRSEAGIIYEANIYDMQGRKTGTGTGNAKEVEINFENFPPGIYVVEVETGEGMIRRKVVRE